MALSYIAGADLSAKEGYVVKMSASATVSLATDGTIAAEELAGVVTQGGGNTSGNPVSVACTDGERTRGVAGGVLTRGTHRYLSTDGNGKLVAAVAGKTVVAEWVGQGPASVAENDIIEIAINKHNWTADT